MKPTILPLVAVAACFSGSVFAGDSSKNPKSPVIYDPPADRNGGWSFSAGAIFRDIGDVSFRTGSRSQNLRLPSLVGRNRSSTTGTAVVGDADAPPLTGIVDRFYVDGFVRPDAGTARDGLTRFFSYDNPGQVRGDTLNYTFSTTGGSQSTTRTAVSSPRSSFRSASWEDDSDFEAGPYIEASYLFPNHSGAPVNFGFNTSFSFINIDARQGGLNTFAQQQRSTTTTSRSGSIGVDTFQLNGVIVPAAPFTGSPDGPGPVIPQAPTSRSFGGSSGGSSSSQTATFFNRIDEELDIDLYTISLGPEVQVQHGALYASLGAGLAINIADFEASHRETLFVSQNGGKAREFESYDSRKNDTDFLYGLYIQGAVGVDLTKRLSLEGFARYDWNESLEGSVGPSSFDVDLTGFSAGVQLSFSF